jgi:hypothetical protein
VEAVRAMRNVWRGSKRVIDSWFQSLRPRYKNTSIVGHRLCAMAVIIGRNSVASKDLRHRFTDYLCLFRPTKSWGVRVV